MIATERFTATADQDFKRLSPSNNQNLWQKINEQAQSHLLHNSDSSLCSNPTEDYTKFADILVKHSAPKSLLESTDNKNLDSITNNEKKITATQTTENEQILTEWLISLFTELFIEHNVTLVHAQSIGKDEPEYLPADIHNNKLAMICFAHGFFASALHEISHWCIAGKHRRTLSDFGYWYVPDGRNEEQQKTFEQVEIKPQAIECILTLACNRVFRVSQDNLFADFDTSTSTFITDVYNQAINYLVNPNSLPRDARKLLLAFYALCQNQSIHLKIPNL